MEPRRRGFLQELYANRSLYALTLPGIVFFLIFAYLPIFGIVIAFQDFNVVKGFLGSPFVGLRNFSVLFEAPSFKTVVWNTLYLNVLFLAAGMASSIVVAVLLNEVGNRFFKRVSQSVLILPHFLSWTVVAMFAVPFLASEGLINSLLKDLGLPAVSFYRRPELWPAILVTMNVWKNAGFGSIVYLATITGIDSQIYEAALIDGADRIQRILRITLPLLRDTAVLLLLMSIGRIFYGNFGLIYPMVGGNSFLFPTTDIIDTYVYRALLDLGDMGMSAAVGLSQSFIGFLMVLATNLAARRFNPDAAIF